MKKTRVYIRPELLLLCYVYEDSICTVIMGSIRFNDDDEGKTGWETMKQRKICRLSFFLILPKILRRKTTTWFISSSMPQWNQQQQHHCYLHYSSNPMKLIDPKVCIDFQKQIATIIKLGMKQEPMRWIIEIEMKMGQHARLCTPRSYNLIIGILIIEFSKTNSTFPTQQPFCSCSCLLPQNPVNLLLEMGRRGTELQNGAAAATDEKEQVNQTPPVYFQYGVKQGKCLNIYRTTFTLPLFLWGWTYYYVYSIHCMKYTFKLQPHNIQRLEDKGQKACRD